MRKSAGEPVEPCRCAHLIVPISGNHPTSDAASPEPITASLRVWIPGSRAADAPRN